MDDSDNLTDSENMAVSYRPTKKAAKGGKVKGKGKKKREGAWKPPIHGSFETMGLCSTVDNPTMRPCGFRSNGEIRKMKDTCMMSRIRKLAMLNDEQPKLCVCITMYNETEDELQLTLSGVIQNYNAMYMDKSLNMR